MRRRDLLAAAAGVATAPSTGAQSTSTKSAAAQPAPRPNILWIMADQFRYDCLGANGNHLIRTPNLDRLAARSANFSHAFVQSPVCVPSRVSYFTGRYPHSHKNRVNYTPLDSSEVLIQQILKDAGYGTGSVGKLHYYPPTADHARSTGFDTIRLDDGISRTDEFSDYVAWRNAHDPKAKLGYHATEPKPGKNPFRGAIDYEYTPTAWTGRETRSVLADFARGGKPFFLFSSFFKPHAPYTVLEPYDSMFDNIDIPLPKQVTLADIQKLPLPAQKQILRGRPQYAMDRQRLEWIYRSYYASVAMIDKEVGDILDTLRQSGQEQNTVVIFSTDHGDQLLEHGLVDKNVFFEASVRVPFLISLPGRIKPGRYDELIEMVDILSTLFDICGLPLAPRVQGRSFAPLVTGGQYTPREFAFAENIIPEVITSGNLELPYVPGKGVGGIRHPDAKMIRTQRWKFNHYPGHGGELYDLQSDPGEERNLYAQAAHQPRVREMKDRLLDFLITSGETDQIAPRWRLE
ncbi:MAG: sulfatase-like hydrolase/transferase [Acidobacteriota bacterium]